MKIKNRKKGFTLIEALIVVAIIGILATLMLVSYMNSLKRGRDSKRVSDIESVKLACNMYADKTGYYPSGNWASLNSALTDYVDTTNIKDPQDPTHTYGYTIDATYGCVLTYDSEVDGTTGNTVYCKD